MRICKSSATLIDNNLISEELQESFKSGILIDNCTDHLPCYVMIEQALVGKKAARKIIGCDMRPKCIDRLKRKLDTTEWDLSNLNSADEKFNKFHTDLSCLIDHFLPVTERTLCSKSICKDPWLTPGLMRSISKCKQLYHATLGNESDQKRRKYTEYNSTLQKIKRHTKKYYYETQCQENKKNTKGLWKIINRAAGKISDKTSIIEYLNSNGLQLHNPKDITNTLGEYFSTVGKKFARKIASPTKNIDDYLSAISSNEKSLFLHPTTLGEISKLIRNLPNKRSSGHDGISNTILKEICEYICEPLCDIFNDSMSLGVFPEKMKLAEVVPL